MARMGQQYYFHFCDTGSLKASIGIKVNLFSI